MVIIITLIFFFFLLFSLVLSSYLQDKSHLALIYPYLFSYSLIMSQYSLYFNILPLKHESIIFIACCIITFCLFEELSTFRYYYMARVSLIFIIYYTFFYYIFILYHFLFVSLLFSNLFIYFRKKIN